MNEDFEQRLREAIALFSDNNFALSDIVKKGNKRGITEAQIRVGMIKVAERIKNKETIKPKQMVWQAWAEAEKIQGEAYTALEKDRSELRSQIYRLTKERTIIAVIGIIGWLGAIALVARDYL